MPTLLQIASIHPDAQARLNASYDLIRAELPAIDAQWLAQNAGKVEGIVTGGHLGAPPSLMTALPNLKVIGINGVGFDKIDLDLARSRGVRVANTPDVLTDDVADLAVGLTIALLRRLPQADAHVRAGKWPSGEMPLATKVSGKRIGIVGLGRIGRAVAKRFAGFTDKIGYTDVAPQDVAFAYYPDAAALAAASDVLIICAAASASTRRIIGAAVFDALGPSGALVNVRGDRSWTSLPWSPRSRKGGSAARRSTCSRTSRTCPLPCSACPTSSSRRTSPARPTRPGGRWAT